MSKGGIKRQRIDGYVPLSEAIDVNDETTWIPHFMAFLKYQQQAGNRLKLPPNNWPTVMITRYALWKQNQLNVAMWIRKKSHMDVPLPRVYKRYYLDYKMFWCECKLNGRDPTAASLPTDWDDLKQRGYLYKFCSETLEYEQKYGEIHIQRSDIEQFRIIYREIRHYYTKMRPPGEPLKTQSYPASWTDLHIKLYREYMCLASSLQTNNKPPRPHPDDESITYELFIPSWNESNPYYRYVDEYAARLNRMYPFGIHSQNSFDSVAMPATWTSEIRKGWECYRRESSNARATRIYSQLSYHKDRYPVFDIWNAMTEQQCYLCGRNPSIPQVWHAVRYRNRDDPSEELTNVITCCKGCSILSRYYRNVDNFIAAAVQIAIVDGALTKSQPGVADALMHLAQTHANIRSPRVYRGSAASRGIETIISNEQLEIYRDQICFYCEHDPSHGVDRKDPFQHYTLLNTVSCCHICNMTKDVLMCEEFRRYMTVIALHHLRIPLPCTVGEQAIDRETLITGAAIYERRMTLAANRLLPNAIDETALNED